MFSISQPLASPSRNQLSLGRVGHYVINVAFEKIVKLPEGKMCIRNQVSGWVRLYANGEAQRRPLRCLEDLLV